MAPKKKAKAPARTSKTSKSTNLKRTTQEPSQVLLEDVRSLQQMQDLLAQILQTVPGDGSLDEDEDDARWQAQEIAFDAMEAPTRAKSLALTRKALALDPDCVDARLNLIALTVQKQEDVLAALEQAVAAGERTLGPKFFKKNKGDFWGLIETRPYMRARQRLAIALGDIGRKQEAIVHFEALLDLNPNDNQGNRELLLSAYLTQDRLSDARRLLDVYDKDAGATFMWGRLLERILSGDFEGAEIQLRTARERNRYVEGFLTGKRKLPTKQPEYYSPGSAEEAVIFLDIQGDAWTSHPTAITWLVASLARQGPTPSNQASPLVQ